MELSAANASAGLCGCHQHSLGGQDDRCPLRAGSLLQDLVPLCGLGRRLGEKLAQEEETAVGKPCTNLENENEQPPLQFPWRRRFLLERSLGQEQQFVRRLVLVLWSNACSGCTQLSDAISQTHFQTFFISLFSDCLSLFLCWCMAHRSALSCSPATEFSPAVPVDLATAPGCLLAFCFNLLFLLIQTTLIQLSCLVWRLQKIQRLCRRVTGACPEGICLLAAQARAHQRTSFRLFGSKKVHSLS